jgi:hypothetical protein
MTPIANAARQITIKGNQNRKKDLFLRSGGVGKPAMRCSQMGMLLARPRLLRVYLNDLLNEGCSHYMAIADDERRQSKHLGSLRTQPYT